jgi:hypothetical protein
MIIYGKLERMGKENVIATVHCSIIPLKVFWSNVKEEFQPEFQTTERSTS